VALGHLTLLHLPYYWDEGGYYIPAALDFYHSGTLIPHFTNAHPPLPNIVLGSLWHVVGFHILATRLIVCAFAAAGLVAVFRLSVGLVSASAAVAVTLLTAVYPIWFAQSTLAHADIFAAAFTLWALSLYLPCMAGVSADPTPRLRVSVAVLFSLAVLSKETSIVAPAALAALHLVRWLRRPGDRRAAREHLLWIAALGFPLLPLLAWYAYHRHVTGFIFGNPEFLRYNATANFTLLHFVTALRYRLMHLFWQRNIWLPILFAVTCFLLPRRSQQQACGLSREALRLIALLVAANWIFFSILGGALLTRYLLPVYPLILLVCVAFWRTRTPRWPLLAAATGAAFVSALWLNPPTSFAPEDNLTYRNMIVVHEQAIDFVAAHYPEATVLTAWPVSADLFRPELGYVSRPIRAFSIDNFTLPEIQKAAGEPGHYDTAIVFTTHFLAPSFRRYLLNHPNSRRGREYAATRDLSPVEIAALLGGRIVWQNDIHGEWAAVLRFDRSYDAALTTP
jgi:4-amino-4-deoxy-L-arabinose transferase-like glycosyltransferase